MFKSRDIDLGKPKLAGRSKALVIDNRDPLRRGRIRVNHRRLGETVWIPYLKTTGFFDVPKIGDLVYVECESGEFEYPIAWGNFLKGKDESPDVPEEFRRGIPTNRGIHTPGGHLMEFDDGEIELTNDPVDTPTTEKNRGVRLTSIAGNKIHIAEDTETGNQFILLEDVNGNFFKTDYKVDLVSINSVKDTDFNTENDRTDNVGNDFTTTVGNNLTTEVEGNTSIETTGTTNIKSDGDTTIDTPNTAITGNTTTAGNVTVAGNSTLGGGTPLVLATATFIGTGNRGSPVISTLMTGATSKSTSS